MNSSKKKRTMTEVLIDDWTGETFPYSEEEDEYVIDLHNKKCNEINQLVLLFMIRFLFDYSNGLAQIRLIHGFSRGTAWSNTVRSGRLENFARDRFRMFGFPKFITIPKDLGNTVLRKC